MSDSETEEEMASLALLLVELQVEIITASLALLLVELHVEIITASLALLLVELHVEIITATEKLKEPMQVTDLVERNKQDNNGCNMENLPNVPSPAVDSRMDLCRVQYRLRH